MMGKKQLSLFIFIITLFSLIVTPGYKVFTGDHAVYIPQIFHQQNPSLFTNDFLIGFNQLKYTFFDEIISNFTNILHIDIFTSFFILTFFTRFIYYYSIYKLTLYFSSDKTFSFFITLLFIPGFFVYGYPYSTMDIILVPRLTALSFNLLFLVFFLNNKKFLSLIPLFLAGLIHPISSIPFIIFFLLELLLAFKKRMSRYLIGVISLAGTILLLFYHKTLLSNLLIFNSLDLLWQNIIRSRNPYYFLSNWNWQILIFLADIILFVIVLLEGKKLFGKKVKRRYAYLLFFIPFCILISYLIGTEIFKLHFPIQLQILRNVYLFKIFTVLFFSCFAYKHIKKYPKDIVYNFFLIGILSSFVFEKSFIFPLPNKGSLLLPFLPGFLCLWLKNKSNLQKLIIPFLLITFSLLLSRILIIRLAILIPLILFVTTITLFIRFKANLFKKYQYLVKPISLFILSIMTIFSLPKFKITPDYFDDKLFMQACEWIENNTNKQDMFITQPFTKMSGPLRMSCLRGVFTCRKDGSFAILFDRDYAFEWEKRMELVNKLKDDYKNIKEITKQYQVDYIFSDSKLGIDNPEVFGNEKYFIYKIN